MFSLRCTQTLLARTRTTPAESPPAPTTVLGDWYAKLVIRGKKQVVLCCSERTFFPVVVVARDIASLAPRLRVALGELLSAIHVPQAAIDEELRSMDDFAVTKTASRVVLGVMNDYAYAIRERDDLLQLSLELADTPLFASTPRVLWPIQATRGVD